MVLRSKYDAMIRIGMGSVDRMQYDDHDDDDDVVVAVCLFLLLDFFVPFDFDAMVEHMHQYMHALEAM